MAVKLLFPCDPLSPAEPDPAFAEEVEAIKELDIPYGLLDLEALFGGSASRAVRRVGEGGQPLLYRGWMIPTGRYVELAEAVAERARRS